MSLKCGGGALFPALRKAGLSTVVVADGFSCKEQIEQDTPRHALHLAEVMQLALRHGPHGGSMTYPEQEFVRPRIDAQRRSMKRAGIAVGDALTAAAVLAWFFARKAI